MTSSEIDDAPLRSTGNMERFNIIRNAIDLYTNIQVAAKYTIPSSVISSSQTFEDLIYSALALTLQEQPLLGVTLADEDTKAPRWVRLPKIDFRDVVKFVDEDPNDNPDDWIQPLHADGLTQRDIPLWRVVVTNPNASKEGKTSQFVISFITHHAIADGLSAGGFHLSILSSLDTLIANPSLVKSSPLIRPPPIGLPANLELKTTLRVTFFFALWNIFKAFFYNPIPPLVWSGSPVPTTPHPPPTYIRSFSLSPSEVTRLVKRCREENTTVTSLIAVLVARKLSLMYPTYERFHATIPFSLRKFTGHGPKEMGVLVSTVEPRFSSSSNLPKGYIACSTPSSQTEQSLPLDKPLWDSARLTKQFIAAGTASTTNQMVNLLKFVPNIKSFFLGKLGQKRDHAFEVTNLGVIDGAASSGVEGRAFFDKLHFSSGLSTYGEEVSIAVVTAKGGDMTVCVRWGQGGLSDEEAGEIGVWLEEGLRSLGRE